MPNPGFMRLGMFVTAMFHGQSMEMHTAVPASAILHLHDRDWVYVPAPATGFDASKSSAETRCPATSRKSAPGLTAGPAGGLERAGARSHDRTVGRIGDRE